MFEPLWSVTSMNEALLTVAFPMCRPSFLKSPFSENVAVIVSALATVSRTSPSKVSGAGSIIAAFFRTIALNGFRWILENSILAPRFFSRPKAKIAKKTLYLPTIKFL